MRLENDIVRSGFFWLPGEESKKVPGTLTIRSGGAVELEIVGLLGNTANDFEEVENFEAVLGAVEMHGQVTLQDCFYRSRAYSFGSADDLPQKITKSVLLASQAILGVAHAGAAEIEFDEVTFTVDGLDEWLGISGLEVGYNPSQSKTSVTYTPPKDLVYQVGEGLELSFVFTYGAKYGNRITEVTLNQKVYVRLRSNTPKSVSEFKSLSYQFVNFLCFAIDDTVTLSDFSLVSASLLEKSLDGQELPARVQLFYRINRFVQKKPNIISHYILFRFDELKGDFKAIFDNWLDAYKNLRPVLELYFSAASNQHAYLEGRFLALAQSLETFHRRSSVETIWDEKEFRNRLAKILLSSSKKDRKWLHGRLRHGNELSLRQRLNKLVGSRKIIFSNARARSKFVTKVVFARNYLTHYVDQTGAGLNDINLWELTRKMEALLQMLILQRLGFGDDELDKLVVKSYKFTAKINTGLL